MVEENNGELAFLVTLLKIITLIRVIILISHIVQLLLIRKFYCFRPGPHIAFK